MADKEASELGAILTEFGILVIFIYFGVRTKLAHFQPCKRPSSSKKQRCVQFGGGGVVVGSIDGPQEALGCVIYCFLMKFNDKKELVTDGSTDRSMYPHIKMRGCI